MRYIGNKTKLLGFIRTVLRRRGITAGVAVDPFSGTASVARELKRLGFHVVAGDIMEYAYVLAKAYVEIASEPDVAAAARELGAHGSDLRALMRELNCIPVTPGFITEHYSAPLIAARRSARMYFTHENAARIDAVRVLLDAWHGAGVLDDAAFFTLLAALIEAADRVANTTGVYAAYVKSWQPNALRPLQLQPMRVVPGNGCRAERADAGALIGALEPFELLYLDPPYNARQYAGYYHLPELIATGWFDQPPDLRGKTGLLPDKHKRSDWSRRSKCEHALEQLLGSANCKHIVMSYNAEGIIPEAAIERLFRQYGRRETYQRYRKPYRRYRSDADGVNRVYAADRVDEYLYCVSR